MGHNQKSWVTIKKAESQSQELGQNHKSWVTITKAESQSKELGHNQKSWVTIIRVGSQSKELGHNHLDFDDLCVDAHCHAAVLSLYLLTTFWDMKGVVHMEFLKQGHTANSEKYISTLRTLKARPRRVSSGRDSILLHDNVRPLSSRQTPDALAQLKLPALPHPAYSPDLAPSDYFFFLKLKKHLKGNHYDSDEEVVAAVRQWCREQSPEFFADGIRQLVQRWQLCVDRDGDSVEKKI